MRPKSDQPAERNMPLSSASAGCYIIYRRYNEKGLNMLLLNLLERSFEVRRCELAVLSTLAIISCCNVVAFAQNDIASYELDVAALETNIRQTNATITADKRLQQQYAELINSLKAELLALKKTPSNGAKSAQVQKQLNQAQQVEANLATNVTNLSQWIKYWNDKENTDRYHEEQETMNGIAANMFDLDGDRMSPNEANADAAFAKDQAEHDARLPSLRHNNQWSN
jgi:hypothetical protein